MKYFFNSEISSVLNTAVAVRRARGNSQLHHIIYIPLSEGKTTAGGMSSTNKADGPTSCCCI